MDANRFDTITRLFAARRSRRQAMLQGGASLAVASLSAAGVRATVAQDATPATEASPTASTPASTAEFLFLQSFERGSIAPKAGADGTYTVTLQHGLGQTLYFSDRPERIVGTTPTPQFLGELGFSPANPPNAALVVDSGNGGVNIAVVELTNPAYDEVSFTATYDITVLRDYERDVDMQFQEAPTDLSTLSATFGSAHLFIDDYDCGSDDIDCIAPGDQDVGGYTQSQCWSYADGGCEPCDDPNDVCARMFPDYCVICTSERSDGSCAQTEYVCTWEPL